MGADTLLWTKVGDVPLRVRAEGAADVAVGDTIQIGIDPALASLFDKTTERRL